MRSFKFLLISIGSLSALGLVSIVEARSYSVYGSGVYTGRSYPYPQGNPYYYSDPYGYGDVVIIQRQPILIERRGSNDNLYEYDNVYGPEASAAGRMSRSVLSPQPQFFRIY